MNRAHGFALTSSIVYGALREDTNMDWILDNKEWLFGGIAVAVPIAILSWLFANKRSGQIQKSGDNSTNIQVGGNITNTAHKRNE